MQAKRLLILIKLAESPQYIFPDYKIAASLSNGLLVTGKEYGHFHLFFSKKFTLHRWLLMLFCAFIRHLHCNKELSFMLWH